MITLRDNNIRQRLVQQQCDSGFATSVHDSESEAESFAEDRAHLRGRHYESVDEEQNSSFSSIVTRSTIGVAEEGVAVTESQENVVRDEDSTSDEEDTTYNYGNISDEEDDSDSNSENGDNFMEDRQLPAEDYCRYRERIFDYSPRRKLQTPSKVLIEEIKPKEPLIENTEEQNQEASSNCVKENQSEPEKIDEDSDEGKKERLELWKKVVDRLNREEETDKKHEEEEIEKTSKDSVEINEINCENENVDREDVTKLDDAKEDCSEEKSLLSEVKLNDKETKDDLKQNVDYNLNVSEEEISSSHSTLCKIQPLQKSTETSEIGEEYCVPSTIRKREMENSCKDSDSSSQIREEKFEDNSVSVKQLLLDVTSNDCMQSITNTEEKKHDDIEITTEEEVQKTLYKMQSHENYPCHENTIKKPEIENPCKDSPHSSQTREERFEDNSVSVKQLLFEIASNDYIKCSEEQEKLVDKFIEEKSCYIRAKLMKKEKDHLKEQNRVKRQENFEQLVETYRLKILEGNEEPFYKKLDRDESIECKPIEYVEEFQDVYEKAPQPIYIEAHLYENSVNDQDVVRFYEKELDMKKPTGKVDSKLTDEPYYLKLDRDDRTECKPIEFVDETRDVIDKEEIIEKLGREKLRNDNIDDVKELLRWDIKPSTEKMIVLRPRNFLFPEEEDHTCQLVRDIMQTVKEENPEKPEEQEEEKVTNILQMSNCISVFECQSNEVVRDEEKTEEEKPLENSVIVTNNIAEIREEMKEFTQRLDAFTSQFNKEYKKILKKCNDDWDDFLKLSKTENENDLKRAEERRENHQTLRNQAIETNETNTVEGMNIDDELEFIVAINEEEVIDSSQLIKVVPDNIQPPNLEGKPRNLYETVYLQQNNDENDDEEKRDDENEIEKEDDETYSFESILKSSETQLDHMAMEIVTTTKDLKNNVNLIMQTETLYESLLEEQERNDDIIATIDEQTLIDKNRELFENVEDDNNQLYQEFDDDDDEVDDSQVVRRNITCTLEMQLAKDLEE